MLKTDYKNWIPDENGRKYSITQDAQGYTKIKDETDYIAEGDNFGASDINMITTAINNLNDGIDLIIPTTGWSEKTESGGNKIYYQVFPISCLETDLPEISLKADENTTPSEYAKGMKQLNKIYKYKTDEGSITLYANSPITEGFTIFIKGVNV